MARMSGAPWRAAAYLRLSREDGDKEESDSIASQRAILTAYADAQPDVELCAKFTDDGFSGANFERPAFRRMLSEVFEGRINCVLVKDLSRLGRDYIEVGRYLEQVFPRHKVRFIAVTEHLDSVLRPDELSGIAVPIKNIMNDEYCRDIARKVKSALDIRRKNGLFIGNYAPYGYIKSPLDSHKLAADPETASTVRQIFDWFVHGENLSSIARRLDGLFVSTPSLSKKQRGQGAQASARWSLTSLRRILSDQTYCGDLVQGRYQSKAYKLRQLIAAPPEQWIIVRDTHEPLIARAVFDAVQKQLHRKTRRPPKQPSAYPLAGLVRCTECTGAMHRHNSQTHAYYVCSSHKRSPDACPHTGGIRADLLEAIVLQALQAHILQLPNLSTVLNTAKSHHSAGQHPLGAALQKQTRTLDRLQTTKAALYADWKNGDIMQSDYHEFGARFDGQIAQCRAALQVLQQQCRQDEAPAQDGSLFAALSVGQLPELSRRVAARLIRAVWVACDRRIHIEFAFTPVSKPAADL